MTNEAVINEMLVAYGGDFMTSNKLSIEIQGTSSKKSHIANIHHPIR